jgi:hypothetical protein
MADVLAILAITLFIRIGMSVHDKIASFAIWGERIEDAGNTLSDSLTNIGDTLSGVPLIGNLIANPFNNASNAAGELQQVGADMQAQISAVALTVGLVVAISPIIVVLLLWLIPRLRFAVRAARVHKVAASPAGLDLLALRALASAPIQDLQRISPHVAEAWRVRDPATIRALAGLALEQSGVKLPVASAPAGNELTVTTAAPAQVTAPAKPARSRAPKKSS